MGKYMRNVVPIWVNVWVMQYQYGIMYGKCSTNMGKCMVNVVSIWKKAWVILCQYGKIHR